VPDSCGELIPTPLRWDKLITPTGEQLAAAVKLLIPRLREAAVAARSHAQTTYTGAMWVDKHASIFRRVLG
jgi:hypothetical protein